jgi:hypothetical protein
VHNPAAKGKSITDPTGKSSSSGKKTPPPIPVGEVGGNFWGEQPEKWSGALQVCRFDSYLFHTSLR